MKFFLEKKMFFFHENTQISHAFGKPFYFSRILWQSLLKIGDKQFYRSEQSDIFNWQVNAEKVRVEWMIFHPKFNYGQKKIR